MKNICTLIIALFITGTTFSQKNKQQNRKDKIKEAKTAFISEKLSLSSADSIHFWPIYNELEVKMQTLRKSNRKLEKEMETNRDTFSEENFKSSVTKIMENENQILVLKKQYFEKMAQVISYKKASQILKIEREFKQKMLKEIKKRKEEGKVEKGK